MNQEMRVESLRNQMLVNLDSILDDITRLAEQPVETERDQQIVHLSLSFLAGMLNERRALACKLEIE